MITVFAKKRIYTGAESIYTGLKKLGYDTNLCCIDDTDPYDYGTETAITDTKEIKKNLEQCDKLILCASSTIDWIMNNYKAYEVFDIFNSKDVSLIIGDSNYCRKSKVYDDICKELCINIHIMPDIAHFCTVPYQVFYPPCPKIENNTPYSDDPFVISHLPGIKYDSNKKGTDKIKEIVSGIKGVEFICQGKTTWEEALKIKQKSSLYIDQLINETRYGKTYRGGLGKNGIEAMLMGIPVITSGSGAVPMFWINENNLESVINRFIEKKGLLNVYRDTQCDWAKWHCTDEVAARNIQQ